MAIITDLGPQDKSRKHRRDEDEEEALELEAAFQKKLKLATRTESEGREAPNNADKEQSSSVSESSSSSSSSSRNFTFHPHISLNYPMTDSRNQSDVLGIGGIVKDDAKVANDMYMHFYHYYEERSRVIKWYSSFWLIIYHFHRWTLRLFNRFYRKYHRKMGVYNVSPYKSFGQILELIELPNINFLWNDLVNILDEENFLEAKRNYKRSLARKKNKSLPTNTDNIQDDVDYDSIRYNYWDRDNLRKFKGGDVNMFDAFNTTNNNANYKTRNNSVTSIDADLDMEIDPA